MKSKMKILFGACSLAMTLLSGATAFAMGSAPAGHGGGGGVHPAPILSPLECSASDSGWEEHWGGHSDCGSCLAKHGNCTENCYRPTFTCTAEGIDPQDNSRQVFSAYSDFSEFDARNQALDRCYYGRLRSCGIINCKQDNQLISSRSCQ